MAQITSRLTDEIITLYREFILKKIDEQIPDLTETQGVVLTREQIKDATGISLYDQFCCENYFTLFEFLKIEYVSNMKKRYSKIDKKL